MPEVAHDGTTVCYRRTMPRDTVLVERDAGVAVVTWNRPRQRNAFSQQMWLEGRDTLRELLDDRDVRAVVVTGAGEAFSAGQDLGEMTTAPADGEHGFPGFMNALLRVRQAASRR
jgi:2-(1,2-epoxy-1,2-dihydrophenyl)acetyl-CoA isomerase